MDRTLEPAIDEFGLRETRLIDPSCGSGHFLLGAFRRLLDKWFKKEPGTPERELVQRALDGVYGVDINPYAAAIARFRLLMAALKASHIKRLKEAPGYRINVTTGDSLLHGRRFGELDLGSDAEQLNGRAGIGHAFEAEDLDELNRILSRRYCVVVGNPPYITVKDKALNQLYRDRYETCHGQYSLAVPFTERFFQLAVPAPPNGEGAGYVGMITANSFMKGEFGKKLVESFFPKVDLTHIVATHNHFVFDRGGKVFDRTAPVIKLPAGATEANHLALLGLLNSSTACFWLKQVCHNKGSTVDAHGARQTTDPFENFFQFNGTKVGMFPVPDAKPLDLAAELDRLARERQAHLPAQLVSTLPLPRADLDTHCAEAESQRRLTIARRRNR